MKKIDYLGNLDPKCFGSQKNSAPPQWFEPDRDGKWQASDTETKAAILIFNTDRLSKNDLHFFSSYLSLSYASSKYFIDHAIQWTF